MKLLDRDMFIISRTNRLSVSLGSRMGGPATTTVTDNKKKIFNYHSFQIQSLLPNWRKLYGLEILK